jgi:hypothetical protein
MIVARETIYTAFWNQVLTAKDRTSGLFPFVTSSRRLVHWANVSSDQQPAIFMTEPQEHVEQKLGVPPKWMFRLSLFIYDNCGSDPTALPGPRVSALLDAIDDALTPLGGPGGRQTLGGLVHRCWINGSVMRYEGIEGMMDQSVAIVPIEILVPDSSGPG